MLKEMLRKLMDQFKIDAVGTPPSKQPEPPLMPQSITPQREMYAVGGLASRFVRKLIRKYKNNPDVKKLEKKISKEEDKLYKLEDKMEKQQDDALEYGEEVGFDDPINQEVYETSRQEIFILEDELEEKLLELAQKYEFNPKLMKKDGVTLEMMRNLYEGIDMISKGASDLGIKVMARGGLVGFNHLIRPLGNF